MTEGISSLKDGLARRLLDGSHTFVYVAGHVGAGACAHVLNVKTSLGKQYALKLPNELHKVRMATDSPLQLGTWRL